MRPLLARTHRRRIALVLVVLLSIAGRPAFVRAQAPTAPKPAAPTKPPARPSPKAPAKAPAPKPAPAVVAAQPVPPPPPAPEDIRFKTIYTTGPQRTESVTYMKGDRERFEFADMVLLKQHDQKRTLQVSPAAKTYLIIPDGAPAIAMPGLPTPLAAPKAPGIVMTTTTIADTGERKPMFGKEARHVKMTLDKQPMPGACDATKQRIETDGWYIDMPKALLATNPQDAAPSPAALGGCVDEIKATATGNPNVLGFPINYTMTMMGEDGKPNVVTMEISEFELTKLDAALFEVPADYTAAGDIRALSKALSDASEAKLAAEVTASTAAPVERKPGVVRVGVPELTNKTTQNVDTRALRARLIANLAEANMDAVPLAAAPEPELLKQANTLGLDYLLVADVTELKVSKGGGLGGMMKAASKVTGGGDAGREATEASISVKLVQPDGKARLSTTTKGKDGGGMDMKTGLGLAKFAGSMYFGMMTGRGMMSAMNAMTTGNLGGMGMLGNPALTNLQTRGLTGTGMGMGMGTDRTAGAASFLMQQAMASDMLSPGGSAGQGPSFDGSLGDALSDATKAVTETLKKADASKKK